jgi:proprotein convertase subtilisin/kexin type 1
MFSFYIQFFLSNRSNRVINPKQQKIVEFLSDACRGTDNEINFLEHIQVITTVQYSQRGALQIDLTSPQGEHNI